MFERPGKGEKAILVQMGEPHIELDVALAEFRELACSAGAEVVGVVTGARLTPEAKYYIGLGKALEIEALILSQEADLVLVNHDLSPSQARNLEKLLNCRVVDRSGLILDIFAKRARTFEGKLQVELAQLQHLSTRLIRGWTHLERQKGGIGLRGPGETQLETDRRLLRERIKYINKRLENVRKSRIQNRRARQKSKMPLVSIVGYTNAGKSTLFNALTGEAIYAADQLFATLDPLMRKLDLPGTSGAILTDTVGFIRQLPHQLIEAFRATLEEVEEADLLLHVIDVSDVNWRENVKAVNQVLGELDVTEIPLLQVFNKIDKQSDWHAKVEYAEDRGKVWVSAHSGDGLSLLKEAIAKQLYGDVIEKTLTLAATEAKSRALLYQHDAVIFEAPQESGGWLITIRMSRLTYQRLGFE